MFKPRFPGYWIALIPIVLLCTGCINSRQIQLNQVWPVHYRFFTSVSKDLAAVLKGYIVRKNGDTLRGYVKMQTNYDEGETISEVPLLPFDKKREIDILHISISDIDLVRIYSPRGTAFEDYMPVGSAMWLLLGRKGQVSLCCQVWGKPYWDDPNNHYNEAALVSGQQVTKISMGPVGFDRGGLVKFINKRYDKHFTTKYFNRKKSAIIKYILDQENLKAHGRSSS